MKIVRELPAESLEAMLSGPALQELRRRMALSDLARLRKEASAEIERLIAFLDASDPYVMTEREEGVDDVPCDTDELELSERDEEDGGDHEQDDCDRESNEPRLAECSAVLP
ncbi:hypothetical protein [Bradyrhizobium sp. CCGB20]|uniref:hypothetical protein n=1 Tax=Bradyrhizobium sp. CCGB20 TaxID=2949633 RepID=UPI0020B31A20|nr:hypothetical protein [Bradyrhizobium sp. CCGB20]MCP3399920.1 hypothetical protein [Bradyrhizobium sp. CCGB20]